MTIPDFQTIMRPIMAMLADRETRSAKEIIASVSDQYDLTEEERSELIPSGTQRRIDNKVHWSLTHMVQAGLLERPKRAHVRITAEGRSALDANPERIDMAVLRTYPSSSSSAIAPGGRSRTSRCPTGRMCRKQCHRRI